MERRSFRVDPQLLDFAREMRSEQAPAEEKLWWFLRSRRLNGFKFRRQVPIDRYVADFYCAECKLVVELDGPSHFADGAPEADAERTQKLESLGLAVVRIQNTHVHENIEGVLYYLLEACENRRSAGHDARRISPSPSPSPPSTRERG